MYASALLRLASLATKATKEIASELAVLLVALSRRALASAELRGIKKDATFSRHVTNFPLRA